MIMSNSQNTPTILFDQALKLQRIKRAARLRAKDPASGADFLLKRTCEDLTDRLANVSRNFEKTLILDGHDHSIDEAILTTKPNAEITAAKTPVEGILNLPPKHADLIVSLLAMQTIDDLPGHLIQCRNGLKPDGLLIACLLGAGSLAELRDVLLQTEAEILGGATPRIAPLADVRDMGGLLQRAGLALPVADLDAITVRYDTLFDLIRDLRMMGCTSILTDRSRKPLTRAFWQRAAALYAEKHADSDGRIRASFNILWISGWAPAPTQPKALKPGSAKMSLADALKVPEGKA